MKDLADKKIPIRPVRTRSERFKDLISMTFKKKYYTPGSVQYVKEMSRKKSRDTTMELVAS